MRLTKRIADLEQRAAATCYDHLSDDDLRARIVEIYGHLARFGLDLPSDWETQLHADPMGFWGAMQPQFGSMAA